MLSGASQLPYKPCLAVLLDNIHGYVTGQISAVPSLLHLRNRTWELAFSVRSSTAEVKVCMPPMAVPIRIPHLLRSSPSKLPGSRLNPALCNACIDRDRDPTSGQVLQVMHAGPTFSSPHPTVKIVFLHEAQHQRGRKNLERMSMRAITFLPATIVYFMQLSMRRSFFLVT